EWSIRRMSAPNGFGRTNSRSSRRSLPDDPHPIRARGRGAVAMIRELAPAKVNLVLRIGPTAPNGLHQVCSLFASLDVADEVEVEPAAHDSIECEGVEGPNLASAAVDRLRQYAPSLPPLRLRITKRIPIAGGLAGGSADAAAG